MKRALIVWGGWDGHQPEQVAGIFSDILKKEDFVVKISDSLSSFEDEAALKKMDLIIPIWTMGEINQEQSQAVIEAVADGVGIAGCHGGMCDAFRGDVSWQFMTGGNWVSHPGGDGVEYTVNIVNTSSPLTDGIQDFQVKSEHYYLHVDPAVEVLAVTRFPHKDITWYHSPNKVVDMPVVWTKRWGAGRVFYNSLIHQANILDVPECKELMRRGFLWAAEGKEYARQKGISAETFKSDKKMF